MAKYPELSPLADTTPLNQVLFLVADLTAVAGTRDRNTTLATLAAMLAGGGGSKFEIPFSWNADSPAGYVAVRAVSVAAPTQNGPGTIAWAYTPPGGVAAAVTFPLAMTAGGKLVGTISGLVAGDLTLANAIVTVT
jgi:hypothetical protein